MLLPHPSQRHPRDTLLHCESTSKRSRISKPSSLLPWVCFCQKHLSGNPATPRSTADPPAKPFSLIPWACQCQTYLSDTPATPHSACGPSCERSRFGKPSAILHLYARMHLSNPHQRHSRDTTLHCRSTCERSRCGRPSALFLCAHAFVEPTSATPPRHHTPLLIHL